MDQGLARQYHSDSRRTQGECQDYWMESHEEGMDRHGDRQGLEGGEGSSTTWRGESRRFKSLCRADTTLQHPIAMTVTDSFDPSVHSSTLLPKTLVRSFDTRLSTQNVLSHASANAIDAVAVLDRQGLRDPPLQPHLPFPYLLTGLTIFTTHEPCLLCSMSLLHSRIAQLYYVRKASGSGGCGSVYSVHEDVGLNHKFEVFALKRGEDGEGWLDILLDP